MPPELIAIADSQPLVSLGLRALVEADPRYRLAGAVSSPYELERLLASQPVRLLIADLELVPLDEPDGLARLAGAYPGMGIVVLANQLGRAEFAELHRLGVRCMLHKTAEAHEVLAAMEAALRGRKYFCSGVLDLLADPPPAAPRPEPHQLTPSEIEIVRMISHGLTTKQIAAQKFISFHTVMTHRKNIFRKMEVTNVSELLMRAIRAGIIDSIEYHI